tara:strand:+ start:57 stop:347 length:291 start_codon:yes stop_codon:yes gene_type:complete
MTEVNTQTETELKQEWKAFCMNMCRTERNRLIRDSDWVHMPDVTISSNNLTKMNSYRQQLRDFPATFSTQFDSMSENEQYGVTVENLNFPAKPGLE